MNDLKKFDDLLGKTLVSIERKEYDDELIFTLDNGDRYKQYHIQDCCEYVYIEDICGELDDLIGMPILLAEEVTYSQEHPQEVREVADTIDMNEFSMDDSFMWTFYKLSTNRGSVTIRWFGSSNGYYSESVNWEKIEERK